VEIRVSLITLHTHRSITQSSEDNQIRKQPRISEVLWEESSWLLFTAHNSEIKACEYCYYTEETSETDQWSNKLHKTWVKSCKKGVSNVRDSSLCKGWCFLNWTCNLLVSKSNFTGSHLLEITDMPENKRNYVLCHERERERERESYKTWTLNAKPKYTRATCFSYSIFQLRKCTLFHKLMHKILSKSNNRSSQWNYFSRTKIAITCSSYDLLWGAKKCMVW